jgi:uncharacterized integral membrane protein
VVHRAALHTALCQQEHREQKIGSYIKSIMVIIVLLFLVTFGVKNSQPIKLHYYLNIETGAFPLYGLVYLSIVIGIIIGMLVGIHNRFDLRRTVKKLEKENRELKEKVIEEEKEQETSIPSQVEEEEIDRSPIDEPAV